MITLHKNFGIPPLDFKSSLVYNCPDNTLSGDFMKKFEQIKNYFVTVKKLLPTFGNWIRTILRERPICEHCGCSMHEKAFFPLPLDMDPRTALSVFNYGYTCGSCCAKISESSDYNKIVEDFLVLRNAERTQGNIIVKLTPKIAELFKKNISKSISKFSKEASEFRRSNQYIQMMVINKKDHCESCGCIGNIDPYTGRNIKGLRFVSKTETLTLDPNNYKTFCATCATKNQTI